MKKTTNLLLAVLMIFAFTETSHAQLWKKLKQKAEDAIVKEVDKTINGDTPSEDEDVESVETSDNENKTNVENDGDENASNNTPEIWRNFRFVPGEDVIFYDDLSSEQIGEFPSRWDLIKGGAEVVKINGEKAIILVAENNNIITPLFTTKDYLGDEFTIEYDIMLPNLEEEKIWYMRHDVYFTDAFGNTDAEIEIKKAAKIDGWAANSNFKMESISVGTQNAWHHIAISYYKGKFKMYYDSKRVSNIPKFDLEPSILGIGLMCYSYNKTKHPYLAIKNIRIAHGGGEMYNRIVADGEYVTNGIIFDSGKSEIKDTSLGIINQIANILEDNPDWKFDIIGHTDSDGTDATNLALSEERANAVKQAIVDQGIKADRLYVIGKGESEPLNSNSTPEEKANNRRVAFVKK
ncbi:OmpA family protein [uncultured Formosa sp.]|uniref:OmpA family protein n=1 Tax=uncultured Formosa sp. TaxID=255435 RepID=UPI00260A5253|nr:OmpA family protein [uncultured Formosa sp.]